MIAAAYSLDRSDLELAARWRASANLFFRDSARLWETSGAQMCHWGPGAPPQRNGGSSLLDGSIDNISELRTLLKLPGHAGPASVYDAAVREWGNEADARIIGNYAAISHLGDGHFRLSRSPWSAPPLFWMRTAKSILIAASPRLIFSGGGPRNIVEGRYAEMLLGIEPEPDNYWFEGLHMVPIGSISHCSRTTDTTYRWYDPKSIAPTVLNSDADYVDAANELVSDAVEAALRCAEKPGLLLSGGLDSAIVADEMHRQIGGGQGFDTFTFTPLSEWGGNAFHGEFADDRPAVESFAAMHEGIRPHFSENSERDFDSNFEKLVAAAGTYRPSTMISFVFDGPAQLARREGCDWLFDAGLGNNSLTIDGRWAYVEFLRTGKLTELWKLARNHPADSRSMLRKLLARSVLPLFPEPVRQGVRTAVKGRKLNLSLDSSLIRHEVYKELALEERARERKDWRTGEWYRSRDEWIDFLWRLRDHAPEMHTASEEVYGLRLRDVTAYRPLMEFFLGVPTDQFVRNGVQRWLGRRIARGRMPEKQRLNKLYGSHHADWHLRMTLKLPDLRKTYEAIRNDKELSAIIDVQRAFDLIDNWPKSAPTSHLAMQSGFHALGGAAMTARYKWLVEGRNEL